MEKTMNERFIEHVLENLHEIESRKYTKGDYDAVVDVLDLADSIGKADLTDRQKEAIRLVYVEDYKQEKACQIVGIKKNTFSFHRNTAISKIARAYRQQEDTENDD